jgi:diguanylate cyclase (GGDEF)-like protein/PAS domain S-box-containing protein
MTIFNGQGVELTHRQERGSEISKQDVVLAHSGNEIDDPISWKPSAAFLKYLIIALMVGAIGFLIIIRTVVPDQHERAVGPLLVLSLAAAGWYLLVRGRKQAAIQVLAYGTWMAATVISALQGGVRTPIVITYPLLILMIGWLISLRAAQTTAALTVAAIISLVLGESWGWLPRPLTTPPAMHGIVQIAVVITSALLIVILVRAYRSRLRELRQVGEALRQRTVELESNKAELNRAQAVANVGSWVCDLANDMMHLSPQTCRIFGLPENTTGSHDSYLARVHPEDRDATNRAWQAALKGDAYDHEHRVLVGRSVRWIRQKAEFEFAPDGTPLSAMGIAHDITERRRIENSLRASTDRLNEAQHLAKLGNWTLDLVSGDLIWSDEVFRLFEINPEQFGASYEAFLGAIHPEDRDAVNRAYEKSLLNRTPYEITHRLRMDDGRIKWVHERCLTHFDAAGRPLQSQGTIQDISENKKAEEKISELAFSDQLTGLPNRRLLLDRLKQFMTTSSRSDCYGALLLIDLDHFKTINDTLGHDEGDLLLKQVAQRLSTCVRAQDTVARLGGDEFVVILANLSTSEAEAAAQTEIVGKKILYALGQTYRLADAAHHSTASIGATLFSGHRATIDDLMKQSDLAMYKSKASGRNTLHFFDPDMETVAAERAALESNLRQAIGSQQLLLYYQAQVVGEGRLTGAEVLVRWQHPQRGIVLPAEFIPLAEETGLILPLGQWILEAACSQLALWADQPEMAQLTLAVNVSARQFRQRDFVDQVLAVLQHTGANPERLKLELTESLLVSNLADVVEKMFALKAKGVGFSLDDFGTGYSSLAYLKRLPLDQLKIDQSFVRDVLSDANDAAIVKTIIALAQSLDLGVIAEGVEMAAQRDFLANAGCHAYQGYFFSRPLPVGGFEEFATRAGNMSEGG